MAGVELESGCSVAVNWFLFCFEVVLLLCLLCSFYVIINRLAAADAARCCASTHKQDCAMQVGLLWCSSAAAAAVLLQEVMQQQAWTAVRLTGGNRFFPSLCILHSRSYSSMLGWLQRRQSSHPFAPPRTSCGTTVPGNFPPTCTTLYGMRLPGCLFLCCCVCLSGWSICCGRMPCAGYKCICCCIKQPPGDVHHLNCP